MAVTAVVWLWWGMVVMVMFMSMVMVTVKAAAVGMVYTWESAGSIPELLN